MCHRVEITGISSHCYIWAPTTKHGPRLYLRILAKARGEQPNIFTVLYEFPQGLTTLSRNERLCLYAFGKGYDPAEIGRAWKLSVSTIRTHLARARKKMPECNSTARLRYIGVRMRDAIKDANLPRDFDFKPERESRKPSFVSAAPIETDFDLLGDLFDSSAML